MFDIRKIMKKCGVTQKFLIDILSKSRSEINRIINSDDDDKKMELWNEVIMYSVDKELYKELYDFYVEFFSNSEDAKRFIQEKLIHKENNIPRRMINSIERLITLADDMENIRKGRVCLKIFFFIVCIETLYKLNDQNKIKRKINMVIDFFNNYISEADKKYILLNVRRSLADSKYDLYYDFEESIDIEIFARIIYQIRNEFAHEGVYWNFTFAHDEITMMNHMTVKEKENEHKEERIYDISLKYNEFREICAKGLINYTQEYFNYVFKA